MAATAAPSAQPASPQDLQATAAALWTFVHLKAPRFTSEAALKVVENLQPRPDEDPKALAKRLRKALSDAGVSLKHTAALDAASRILGHSSWHARNRERGAECSDAIKPFVSMCRASPCSIHQRSRQTFPRAHRRYAAIPNGLPWHQIPFMRAIGA